MRLRFAVLFGQTHFIVLTCLMSVHIPLNWLWHLFSLTLILLTWRIWWANNASKWQTGFSSVFKGLIPPPIFSHCRRGHYWWLDLQKSAPWFCSPLSSIHNWLSTLKLPTFWPREGCTPRMLFCGRGTVIQRERERGRERERETTQHFMRQRISEL